VRMGLSIAPRSLLLPDDPRVDACPPRWADELSIRGTCASTTGCSAKLDQPLTTKAALNGEEFPGKLMASTRSCTDVPVGGVANA
jgi:hypothetical protein